MTQSSLLITPKSADGRRTETNDDLAELLKQLKADDDEARSFIREYVRRRKKRGRKKKKSSPDIRRPRNQHSATLGQSIASFCEEEGIGRSTFYVWEQKGIAPEVLRPTGPRQPSKINDIVQSLGRKRITDIQSVSRRLAQTRKSQPAPGSDDSRANISSAGPGVNGHNPTGHANASAVPDKEREPGSTRLGFHSYIDLPGRGRQWPAAGH